MRSPKAKREARIARAVERQAVASERTPAEQLRRLERRGDGHCAEADRIRIAIEKESQP